MSRVDKLLRLYRTDPCDADVPYMIAQEHARAGDHTHAIQWYDTCLKMEPAYHYAYYHKAKSLEALERAGDAMSVLRDGLTRAKSAGDSKAANEIAAYLDELTP